MTEIDYPALLGWLSIVICLVNLFYYVRHPNE